jgi:plastocyanin
MRLKGGQGEIMRLISKTFVALALLAAMWPASRGVAASLTDAQKARENAAAKGSAAARDATSSTPAAKSYSIEIKDFAFVPAAITVPVGAKITWLNKDEEPHTVVSTENAFKSKALDTDESFSFTANKGGTYRYFCSVHPRMVGEIVVK